MLQIFKNTSFGEVRVLEEQGSSLFCAADVCRALQYVNPRDALAKHCEEEDVAKRDTLTTKGMQAMSYVTESGLYALIFGSKMPAAKEFKRWVTSEVLPAIRKSGGYMVSRPDESAEDLMARALLVAQETLARSTKENKELKARVEVAESKAVLAEAIEASTNTILIAELSKILQQNGVNIGHNRLFAWMRTNGYLCSNPAYYNQPTQKAMQMGLFEVAKHVIQKPNGTSITTFTPRVTGKGQAFFCKKFLTNKETNNVRL